jgi:RNA polymerase sigma factor (sigma-70 family)
LPATPFVAGGGKSCHGALEEFAGRQRRDQSRMSVTSFDRVSDEQLAMCAAQNVRCVEAFLARYEEKIRACAWRMVGDPNEIEDLTQETVLRVLRSLPAFKGKASATTWVYRIAHNTCVDAHRRRAARPQTAPLEFWDERIGPNQRAGNEADPALLLEGAVSECFVEHALGGLPATTPASPRFGCSTASRTRKSRLGWEPASTR